MLDIAIIVELITAVPYFISMIYLMVNFTEELGFKNRKNAYVVGTLILYVAALYNMVINAYSLSSDFTPYIVSVLTFLVAVCVINRDSIKRKIVILVWLLIPTLIIELLMEFWMYFFVTKDVDALMADPVSNVYTRMFSTTFTICVNICVVLIRNRRKLKSVAFSVVFLALFPIVQAMYLTLILAPEKSSGLSTVLVVNVAFEIIFTVMYFMYVNFITITNRVYKKEQEQALIEGLRDVDKQYYSMVQEEIERVRFIRHDIGNYVEQLEYLMNKEDKESSEHASSMLNDLKSHIKSIGSLQYCEEATVNMVLTLADAKAREAGVKIDIDAVVPEKLDIDLLDLSSAVSNLCDNAIRAASESDEKTASIKIALQNEYLVIKTENRTNDDREITDINKLKSTKSDNTTMHGLGLQILREIATKYDGDFTVNLHEGTCTFVLLMNAGK